MWPDTALRDRLRKEARSYAGRNPGVRVTIRREIPLRREQTFYRSMGRGRSNCVNCHNVFKRHAVVDHRYQCPDKTYYETVATYINWAKEPVEWE